MGSVLALPRPVTRGHFRLSYGGAVSGCMDVNSAKSAAGGYSVKARLEELEEVGHVHDRSQRGALGVFSSKAFRPDLYQ